MAVQVRYSNYSRLLRYASWALVLYYTTLAYSIVYGVLHPGGGERPLPIGGANWRHRLVRADGNCAGKRRKGDFGLDAKNGGRDVRDSDAGLCSILQHVGGVLDYSRTSQRCQVLFYTRRKYSIICGGTCVFDQRCRKRAGVFELVEVRRGV